MNLKVGDLLATCYQSNIAGVIISWVYVSSVRSIYAVTMFMLDTKEIENFILNMNDGTWKVK